ncbi:MAG TPA: hypothetical protein VFR86_26505 [Burkholderiaceae bacterium]|nr:hypothetical protein [Burkholderiaceae bacterium]
MTFSEVHKMPSLSEQIAGLERQYAALEQQRASLQKQMEQVATRLTKIKATFDATGPKGANGSAVQKSKTQAAKPAKKVAAKKAANKKPAASGKPAKAAAKRTWFQPGEAVALIRKTLKKPMTQGEVVQSLAEAKGYAGKLSRDEYKSFQGASYMAIAQAAKARTLTKAADGTVSPRG